MNAFLLLRLAATIDLGLIAAELCFHVPGLPIGGGHAEQLVAIFVSTYVAIEVILVLRAIFFGRE